MRMLTFAMKNTKELLRDPLNITFSLGFPIAILLLLSAIQSNVPMELFAVHSLVPGITVFGLSFLTLFSATQISKDRCSSLLQRLYTTPMSPVDYILGYTIPLVPMAVAQCAICYVVAIPLGLDVSMNIQLAIAFLVPISILFIALGLLFGSILNDRQVGGVCGALLTNLTAWLSGTWFDLSLVGGMFETVCNLLPFVHAVEMERAVLAGDLVAIFPHMWWVLGYAAVVLALAIFFFLRQMRAQ